MRVRVQGSGFGAQGLRLWVEGMEGVFVLDPEHGRSALALRVEGVG